MSCWDISPEFNECCQITNYGIMRFNFSEFNKISSKLRDSSKLGAHGIKSKILNMLKGLMHVYRDKVIESFFELWVSESKITKYPPVPNLAINRRKIIEIMKCLDIHTTT